MDYKTQYLQQKKQYEDLRDKIMGDFNLSIIKKNDIGFIDKIKNAIFGSNNEDSDKLSEGGALSYQNKSNVEIIFLNSDSLIPGSEQFNIIKGELLHKNLKDRESMLNIKQYTINLNKLVENLNNKAYMMRINDKQANLISQLKNQSGGENEYTNVLNIFNKLSYDDQEKFINEVLGYNATIVGGGLPKPIKMDFIKSDLNTNYKDLKPLLDAINKRIKEMKTTINELYEKGRISQADRKKFIDEPLMDTILVIEKDSSNQKAKLLAVYKDYESYY